MDKRFKNKYRIASNRLPGWDYSEDGIYFLTLVIQNRDCFLGEIMEDEMILSDWGKIVKNELLKSFEIRSELTLNEFVIMPNHIHLLVTLGKVNLLTSDLSSLPKNSSESAKKILQIQLDKSSSSRMEEKEKENSKFYRKPKSISSFIAGFKSTVISKIDDDIDQKGLTIPKFNRNNLFFQTNYFDRIIRNKQEFFQIKNYIRSNPKNWDTDELNEN